MIQEHELQKDGEGPNASPQPPWRPGNWAALDADYGGDRPSSPDYPTGMSTTGLVGYYWHVDLDPPSDIRLRIERPVLFLWLLISGLWQGFVPWLIMGLALIAYAIAARPAFRQFGWAGQPWVYCGFGLGQIMLACSFVANLSLFWPFIGLYWLAVILTWFTLEWRRMRPL